MNTRKCKTCEKEFNQTVNLKPCCSPKCYGEYTNNRQKERKERAHSKYETLIKFQKNTKREITQATREAVMNRDGGCIICLDQSSVEIHHALYGIDAEFTPDRNDPNKLVWLCVRDHHQLHSHFGNDYRQYCKNYLVNYYA